MLAFGSTDPTRNSLHPRLREDLVRRADLLGRLKQERCRPLILVTAPAGYGKTTLLAQWAAESARPCAWVTLDRADQDAERLASSISAALDAVGIEPGLRRSFVLVLDDAHVVGTEALQAAVLRILDWLPEWSQLAVASRREPALPLGRMRAQRLLLEFGAMDLAMSTVEAGALLAQTGLDAESKPIQALARRSEGWPVALELAALSWMRRREPAEPSQLRGDDRLISEYFRAELLASCPPATQRFLMRSSVLDCLSGAACDAVLGRTGSAHLLAELSTANVPLRPLDSSHESFRLHGLFREMLQTELRRSEPELARLLHRRASDWYVRSGDVERAVDHARQAEDLHRVGELLWRHLHRFLGEGRNEQVQGWLRGVDAERAAGCPELALAAAHSGLALGSVAQAERWARAAAVGLSDTAEQRATSAPAGVLIVDAWAARSGAGRMGHVAAQAYDLLRDDDPWRASCCFLTGSSALLTGDRIARRASAGGGRPAGRGAGAECGIAVSGTAVDLRPRARRSARRIRFRSRRAVDRRLPRLANDPGLRAGVRGLRRLGDAGGAGRRGEGGDV